MSTDVSSPSQDPVKDYLKQIGKVPLLTADEEVELAKRIEAGIYAEELLRLDDNGGKKLSKHWRRGELLWVIDDGQRAKKHMIEANLRLVVDRAKRYTGRGVLFLDLIQEGNHGLIHAVKKFDYTKGYKFSTYSVWWIRQAITRSLHIDSRTIRVPVYMSEFINSIRTVIRTLTLDLGRGPTIEEIAKNLEVEPSKVEEALKYDRDPVSLDQPLGDDDQSQTFADVLVDQNAAEPWDEVAVGLNSAWMVKCLDVLDKRKRDIIEWRYGLKDGFPRQFTWIGRNLESPISGERVRQLEREALTEMYTSGLADIVG